MAMLPIQTELSDFAARRGGCRGARRMAALALAVATVVALSGCLAGAEPVVTSTPTSDIRDRMTADDRHIAAMTVQIAMERRGDNEASTWTNDLSGNHGAVVPRRTFRSVAGDYCRRYEETLTIAGVTATVSKIACRDGSGRWTSMT